MEYVLSDVDSMTEVTFRSMRTLASATTNRKHDLALHEPSNMNPGNL